MGPDFYLKYYTRLYEVRARLFGVVLLYCASELAAKHTLVGRGGSSLNEPKEVLPNVSRKP
jgi:hypothetical protein